MVKDNQRGKSLGFMNFAESYFDSAEALIAAQHAGELSLRFDAPIYLLHAHALELALKALLLETGANQDEIESFRHNILKIYDELRTKQTSAQLIASAEGFCRQYWKDYLRNARDSLRDRLGDWITNEDNCEEFGILSNAEIGNNLPELRNIILWLDEHHASNGSQFRYYKTGVHQRPTIKALGLTEDIVLCTMRAVFPHIFREFLARNLKK